MISWTDALLQVVRCRFQGNIPALTSIALGRGAGLFSRALARNGDVILLTNLINVLPTTTALRGGVVSRRAARREVATQYVTPDQHSRCREVGGRRGTSNFLAALEVRLVGQLSPQSFSAARPICSLP